MRSAIVAASVALAAPLALAPAAEAGAVAYGATLDRETALVSARDGAQRTVVSIALRPGTGGPGAQHDRPAVVIPVPSAPETTVLEGPAAEAFRDLGVATAPRSVDSEAARSRGEDLPRPPHDPLVSYETTVLPAGDYGALSTWLRRHELTTPGAQARELRRYADAGWAFVGLRLEGPVGSLQTLRPLEIAFASDRVQYPLRVLGAGTDDASVTLYVAGPHRVTARGFDTYHAGWIDDLDPTPNPDVQALLGGEEYLTKLAFVDVPPAELDRDLVTAQGVSDRLFRSSVDFPFESESAFATAPLPPDNAPEVPFDGPPGWLWIVLLPAVVVLVGLVGLVLRWRSSRG